ncbi:MAG: hypothetical protein WC471_03330 [Candidatus Woesearchaeota archaeon]|jgi:hypothetical protein
MTSLGWMILFYLVFMVSMFLWIIFGEKKTPNPPENPPDSKQGK